MESQPGPQRTFETTKADIAVLGGAAGGGKTFALLLDPLRYIQRFPGFGAVIFRRTCPEITAEGGIWDQAGEIYPYAGGRPRVGDLTWVFKPFGNTISFSHMEHENTKYNWSSSQICCIEFDELQLFTESQFFFMLSRNRSLCGVQPYIRGACNPSPDWLKSFLSPWVDDEYDGLRAASGELRWFVRELGKIKWVPEGTPDAKSVTFVRSTVYDNKILLERNPEYLANLKALPPLEQEQLLHGNWNVRREGLVYYKPENGIDFQTCIVNKLPENLTGQAVGGIDYGYSNPFAAPWGILDYDDVLWIIEVRYQSGMTTEVHADALPAGYRWWCDPAQPELRVKLRQAGHDVLPCVHLMVRGASGETKTPILSGIDVVADRIRRGKLKIYRPKCLPLIKELGLYHYDPTKATDLPIKQNDHACFPAEVLVTTIKGDRPIDQIAAGDLVLTRSGYFPVTESSLTKRDASLWKIEFSDERTLVATRDHPIWTENRGWIRLDALRYGDTMVDVNFVSSHQAIGGRRWRIDLGSALSIRRLKRSSSRERFIADGPMQNTEIIGFTSVQGMASTFIVRSGNIITDQYQMDTTSITRTTTDRITISATSNAFSDSTTFRCMPRRCTRIKSFGHGLINILRRFAHSLLNGMAPRKGWLGIASMANKPGRIESRLSGHASNAGPNTNLSRYGKATVFARTIASLLGVANPASMTKIGYVASVARYFASIATASRGDVLASVDGSRYMPTSEKIAPVQRAAKLFRSRRVHTKYVARVHVLGIIDLNKRADVYNLTVDGPHEFFANGILVKNCDALRYLCVGLTRGHTPATEIRADIKAESDRIQAQIEADYKALLKAEQDKERAAAELKQKARQADPFDSHWWQMT